MQNCLYTEYPLVFFVQFLDTVFIQFLKIVQKKHANCTKKTHTRILCTNSFVSKNCTKNANLQKTRAGPKNAPDIGNHHLPPRTVRAGFPAYGSSFYFFLL